MPSKSPHNRRGNPGNRRSRAKIDRYNGTQDTEHGHYVYLDEDNWDTYIEAWPCEFLTTDGVYDTEDRYGASHESTHVLFGEYWGAQGVEPGDRVTVDGVTYTITAAFDPLGDKREMRIEARRKG